MTALPANNTDRYFFRYSNAQHEHTLQVRTATGLSYTTVVSALENYLTILTGAFAASEGLSVELQLAGDNFSTPVTEGVWSTFSWGSTAATPETDATFLGAQGRSTGGHKVRLDVFGYKNALSDFRITNAEVSGVDDAVAVLNGIPGAFLSIDGLNPQWYQYLNVKSNDYWVRQARG